MRVVREMKRAGHRVHFPVDVGTVLRLLHVLPLMWRPSRKFNLENGNHREMTAMARQKIERDELAIAGALCSPFEVRHYRNGRPPSHDNSYVAFKMERRKMRMAVTAERYKKINGDAPCLEQVFSPFQRGYFCKVCGGKHRDSRGD